MTTCVVNCVPKSEYEYYLKLLEYKDEECIGGLITISFEPKIELMIDLVVEAIPAFAHYWNSHKVPRAQVSNLQVVMCLRHWLEMASMLSSVAKNNDNPSLKRSSYQIVTECCKASGYDYKEILPYMTSMLRLEHNGDLYKEL